LVECGLFTANKISSKSLPKASELDSLLFGCIFSCLHLYPKSGLTVSR